MKQENMKDKEENNATNDRKLDSDSGSNTR
jgi:hypothetical protein